MESTKIIVSTIIDADRKKIWNYWNDPEHITQWNFADDSWHCPKGTKDLKIGGKYNARMEAKDGSFGFDFEAVYDEVVDHEQISYAMHDGRQATTMFEDFYGSTKVKTTFYAES